MRTLLASMSVVWVMGGCVPVASTPTPEDAPINTKTPGIARITAASPTVTLLPTPTTEFILPELNLQKITRENLSSIAQIKMLGDGRVRHTVFSPDGRWIASGSTLGVRIHRADNLAETTFLPGVKPVSRVAFSADGTLLAVGSDDGMLRLYAMSALYADSLQSRQPVLEIRAGYFPIQALYFAPDGKTIASGSLDRTISIWNTSTGKRVVSVSGFTLEVSALAYSADSTLLAGSSLDGSTRIWRIRTGKLLASYGTPDKKRLEVDQYPLQLAFMPGGWLLSTRVDGVVSAWNWLNSEAEPAPLLEGLQGVACSTYDEEKGTLVIITLAGGINISRVSSDASNIPVLELLHTFPIELDVISAALSPDGNRLLLASYPASLHLLDLDSGAMLTTYARAPQGQKLITLAFSPEGSLLASAHGDGLVRVWDVRNMQNYFELVVSPDETTRSLLFSGDGKQLIGAADAIYVFATADFQKTLAGQMAEQISPTIISLTPEMIIETVGSVASVDLSPNGRYLASANLLENTVSVWDAKSGQLIGHLSGSEKPALTVAFSPDGQYLAVGGADHNIHIWNTSRFAQEGEQVSSSFLQEEEDLLIRNEFAITSMAYTFDGNHLVAAGAYPFGRVMDSGNGGLIFRLKGSKDQLVSLAVSMDGSLVATGGADGKVRIHMDKGEEPALTLTGHAGMVNALAFSPDGRLLISGGEDGTIRVWGVP